MALENEAWFIHAVSENVTQLAQQKRSKIRGSVFTKDGVIGKTYPFQRLAATSMVAASRDTAISFINPGQTKRRAILEDFQVAVLIDDFDKVKELANPESEFAMALVKSRERQLDDLVIGKATGDTGGILGLATSVDEANESTGTVALSAEVTAAGTGAQAIANGSANMTLSKILDAKQLMDINDVDDEDRYFFYSPQAMRKMLSITEITNSDYNTIKALAGGGLPMDYKWCGFYWRMTTRLPKSGNIRSCIAVQKNAVGLAIGMVKEVDVHRNPNYWNNVQCIVKLSAGAVRIDASGVVQVDIDESV